MAKKAAPISAAPVVAAEPSPDAIAFVDGSLAGTHDTLPDGAHFAFNGTEVHHRGAVYVRIGPKRYRFQRQEA